MRRVVAFLAALALVLAVGPPAAATAPPAGLMDGRIATLTFEGDAAPETKSWSRLTELSPGRTLSEGAIRRSIRNLFATRRFLDLSVEASPGPEGLRGRHPVRGGSPDRVVQARGKGDSGEREAPGLARSSGRRPLGARCPRPSRGNRPGASPRPGLLRAPGRRLGLGRPRGEHGRRRHRRSKRGRRRSPAGRSGVGSLGPVKEEPLAKEARQKSGKAYREARARSDAERFEKYLREKGCGTRGGPLGRSDLRPVREARDSPLPRLRRAPDRSSRDRGAGIGRQKEPRLALGAARPSGRGDRW